MHRTGLRIAAVSLALAPTVAFAHTGHEGPGLVAGFLHPLGGVDHIIAMVAVGLLAARLGGRALWLVPASFVGTMAVAGLAGMAGAGVPYVETGIALSVVVLAAVAILGVAMPVAAALGLVGFFAVFPRYSPGSQVPRTGSGLAYRPRLLATAARAGWRGQPPTSAPPPPTPLMPGACGETAATDWPGSNANRHARSRSLSIISA